MDETGGSNGARIRFAPESGDIANVGLAAAAQRLLPFARNYSVSLADTITLAGATAIEVTGGPYIAWKAGRMDLCDGSTSPANGRIPSAIKDAHHIHDVFARLTFTPEETVALTGAHVLGASHGNISNFVGPWVVNNRKFSNEYFR